MSPATTGETENGRSINAVSSVRPGKLNFAIAQAAVTPNTRLSSSAVGATTIVSLIAANVS